MKFITDFTINGLAVKTANIGGINYSFGEYIEGYKLVNMIVCDGVLYDLSKIQLDTPLDTPDDPIDIPTDDQKNDPIINPIINPSNNEINSNIKEDTGGILIPKGTVASLYLKYPIAPVNGSQSLKPSIFELNIYHDGLLVDELLIDSSFSPKFTLYKNLNLINVEFRGSTWGYDDPYVLTKNSSLVPQWAKEAYYNFYFPEHPGLKWDNLYYHPLIITYSGFDTSYTPSLGLFTPPDKLAQLSYLEESDLINEYADYYENNRMIKVLSKGASFDSTGEIILHNFIDTNRFGSQFSYGAVGETLVIVELTIPENIVKKHGLSTNKVKGSSLIHQYVYRSISQTSKEISDVSIHLGDTIELEIENISVGNLGIPYTYRSYENNPEKFWINDGPNRYKYHYYKLEEVKLQRIPALDLLVKFRINGGDWSEGIRVINNAPEYYCTPALSIHTTGTDYVLPVEGLLWKNGDETVPTKKTFTIHAPKSTDTITNPNYIELYEPYGESLNNDFKLVILNGSEGRKGEYIAYRIP